MAMTDAQRQQKRRDKLKQQAAKARFDPVPYLGQAVCDFAQQGKLSKELCEELRVRAFELFNERQLANIEGPANQVLMQRYFSVLLMESLNIKE